MGTYEISTTGGTYQVNTEDQPTSDYSLSGFGKNAWEDVKGNVEGLAKLPQALVEHPLKTVESVPGALINEGKRIGVGQLLTGHPIEAGKQFINAAYQKPLTTTMDVAPLLGAAGKALGIGGEAGEAAEMAEGASGVAKTTPTVEDIEAATREATENTMGPEDLISMSGGRGGKSATMEAAEDFAKNPPPPPPPPKTPPPEPSMVDELQSYLGQKYGQVKNAANAKYETVANQPGWPDTLSDYMNRWAQNMSVKNIGGSPRQVGQLGPEASRAVGQFALDKEITSPTVGDIGMEKKISDLVENAGSKVGAYRKLATARAGPIAKDELLNTIKAQLDPVYTKGIESGQKGAYMKALQEVNRADMTHDGLSQLATKLNKAATDAKRLQQASGATTDVANAITRFNNDRIAQVLKPDELADYKSSLNDFGMGKKLQQFNAFKQRREIGGRLGPGGGVRQMAQTFLDHVGYKAGAKIASNMSRIIKANPAMAKSLPSMFGEFVDQVEDLIPEDFTHGAMAHGGIVGEDDLNDYLASKYANKKGESE